MPFLRRVSTIPGIEEINMTTNGVLMAPFIPELKELGIKSLNLSLDTLDRERFFRITRRDELPKVMDTFHTLLQHNIAVKINAVVMAGQNTEDIIPLAQLTKDYPVSVRFIEEMPFNGGGVQHPTLDWNYLKILTTLQEVFPGIQASKNAPNATAQGYVIPGHVGTVGIIAAFTRTFCGTCNRIRVTAQGGLKTCLYGEDVLNIRDILRANATNEPLVKALFNAFGNRAKDGYEAEQNRHFSLPVFESMSSIGG
jgi:cyclic pyranopterin phosphate synthase